MPETVPRRARRPVRHRQPPRARRRHRRRDPGDARRRAPRCSSAMGGNFASATPDTAVTEAALRSCSLTVQVSTKLNRSHLVHGTTALILPSLGRTDKDIQSRRQTDGVGRGFDVDGASVARQPARRRATRCAARWRSSASSPGRCSGPTIRCRGRSSTTTTTRSATRSPPWCPAAPTTTPGSAQPDGFQLPHPPRDSREFPTRTGKANFAVNPLEWVPVPHGPAGAADAAQPRPVQHHHLRAR